jgi:hypothetical protein
VKWQKAIRLLVREFGKHEHTHKQKEETVNDAHVVDKN